MTIVAAGIVTMLIIIISQLMPKLMQIQKILYMKVYTWYTLRH